MRSTTDLKTDWIRTGDDLIIRMELPAWSDKPILFVEHFDEMLRVRGQAGSGKAEAFTKSIPIRCGAERPTAFLQDGVLSIRVKSPDGFTHSTIPVSIT